MRVVLPTSTVVGISLEADSSVRVRSARISCKLLGLQNWGEENISRTTVKVQNLNSTC